MHRRSVTSSAAGMRRLVLGIAFALGLAFWLLPDPHVVRAATLGGRIVVAQVDSDRGNTPAAIAPAPGPSPTDPAPGKDASKGVDKPDFGVKDAGTKDKASVDVTIDAHGVGVLKDGKRIRVQGLGNDREYDSFEQFARDAPGTALFVFLIVTVVFLVPLLIIALLVWYKIRKTRMHNETMLKLAERGIVTPAAAMEALAAGPSPAASLDAMANAGSAGTPPAAGSAPLYDQARQIRRRTAWSDLRKGVILTALGVGLSLYSMFDDGTPNGVGLILLFLGLGYCVLWYFEDRTPDPRRNGSPPPSGGA
jgi:hypothetical protein